MIDAPMHGLHSRRPVQTDVCVKRRAASHFVAGYKCRALFAAMVTTLLDAIARAFEKPCRHGKCTPAAIFRNGEFGRETQKDRQRVRLIFKRPNVALLPAVVTQTHDGRC